MTVAYKIKSISANQVDLVDERGQSLILPVANFPTEIKTGETVFVSVVRHNGLVNDNRQLAEEILNQLLPSP